MKRKKYKLSLNRLKTHRRQVKEISIVGEKSAEGLQDSSIGVKSEGLQDSGIGEKSEGLQDSSIGVKSEGLQDSSIGVKSEGLQDSGIGEKSEEGLQVQDHNTPVKKREITQVAAPKTKTRKKSENKRRGLLAHPKNATRLGEMITTYKKPGVSRPILSKRVVKNGFQTNFLSQVTHFWKTKQFCDLRLIIGNIEVLAHQLVFNVARPFCLSSLKELEGNHPLLTLLVPVKASEEAVTNFLLYLYEGSLFITENTVHEILNLGKFFRMTSVEYFCNAFLVAVQRAAGTDTNPLLPETQSRSEQTPVSETNTEVVLEKDSSSANDGEIDESQRRSPAICRKWRLTPKAKTAKVSAADSGNTQADDQQSLVKDAYWTAWGVKDVRTVGANGEADGSSKMTERDEDLNLRVHFGSETSESGYMKGAADQVVGEADDAVNEGVDETPISHGDDDPCEGTDAMETEGVNESHHRVVNVSWSDEENQEWVVMPNESEDNMFEDEEHEEMNVDLENKVEQKEDVEKQSLSKVGCLEAVSLSQDQYEHMETTNRDPDKISTMSEGILTDTDAEKSSEFHKDVDSEDIKPILLADGTILNQNSLCKKKSPAADHPTEMEHGVSTAKGRVDHSMVREPEHVDGKPKGEVDHGVDTADNKAKAERIVDMDKHPSSPPPARTAQTDVGCSVDRDKLSEDVDQKASSFDHDTDLYRHAYMDDSMSPGEVEIDHAEEDDEEDEDVDVKPVILPDGSVCVPNAKPVLMFGNDAESPPLIPKAETEVFEHENIYFRYYKCDQCPSLFTSKARQEEHVQVIHHGLRFVCKFCGKEFTSKCGHRMHEKDHLGQNPYRKFKCLKCQERFASKEELRDHRQKVCQEFRCGTCREVFFTQHYFQKHEIECANSLECKKCHRSFRDKYRLSKHLENHLFKEVVDTVSKPPDKYKCKICSKEFTGKKHYLKHKSMSHGKKRPQSQEIQCSECNKTFKCLSSMRRHFKAEHPNSNLPTSAQMNWRDLTRESPFQEDHVDETASEDEMMTEMDPPKGVEINQQDEIPKQDEETKSKSKRKTKKDSKESENVTGSKNFHCGECGMSFSFFASLRRHSKSEHPKTTNFGGVC